MKYDSFMLATVSVSALLIAGPVHGQEVAKPDAVEAATQAPAPASDASDIVVTGSRLKGAAPVGSSLVAIGRGTIEISNATTTSQLLANLPQVNNLGVSENIRSGNGASANFNFAQGINVHAIGPYATLLLIDGQRVAPQGALGLTADTSVIPTIALERIEVVADGASAIYGSDAVAGVANLILRRKFDGIEATSSYGVADDYRQYQAGIIAGTHWSSGYATLSYAYSGHSSLSASDRSFAKADLTGKGGADFRSTQCNPGNILIDGVSYAIPMNGVTQGTSGVLVPGTSNRCDNFKNSDLLPNIRRHNVVGTVNQDIIGGLSVWGTGIYSHRAVFVRAGIPTTTLTVPASNAFYTRPAGSGTSTETVRYAFNELPESAAIRGVAEFFQGTFGARLKLPHDWEASASFTYGGSNEVSSSDTTINNTALQAALASSDPNTAFNPYGVANRASVLATIGNGITGTTGKARQDVADFSVTGGLFELPGGEVRLAVGYQHQRTNQVAYSLVGNTTAPGSLLLVDFTRHVNSVFGELLIPLVGSGNAIPGIHSLQIDVAGRYDHYSDVGSTRNPKVGVNWEPVKGLLLHGSYGTSFRAPPVFQSQGGAQSLVTSLSDPLLGGASTTVLQIAGGNPTVRPETATTYSFGADIRPALLPGVNVSVSYFHVKYKDIITALGNNAQLLNQSYYSALGIITRNPTPAQVAAVLATYPFVSGSLPANVPVLIDARTRNLAAIKAEGLDFSADYSLSTKRAGDFNLGIVGTYYLKFDSIAVPGAPVIDLVGTTLNPVRFQLRPYLGWRLGNVTTRATVNITDSYENNLVVPARAVSGYATLDLHLDYDLSRVLPLSLKNLRLGVDVTNAFNAEPPFISVGPSIITEGGFDASLVNPVGRIIAISLTAKY
ncbi:MAG: TonB-dependent receptor-like protein [Bradyrhizobium sp.]|nr:TonB-dependent receptor-like protein [Bradyrhizobium sp.]